MEGESIDYLESGFILHRFAVLKSTNETAKEMIFSKEKQTLDLSSGKNLKRYSKGFAVLAGQQKAGKGRRGNKWVSPPGNLYLSIAFPLPVPVIRASEIGFLTANIVWDALVHYKILEENLVLKWPNDVLYQGKKIAGILPECELINYNYDSCKVYDRELKREHNIYWLIVGIGLNIASSPPESMTRYGAANLSDQGVILQPDDIAVHILNLFSNEIEMWAKNGFERIRTVYESRMIGEGCAVSVRLPNMICQGRVVGLDVDGALLMCEEQSGLTRRITAGELFFDV